MWQLWVSSNLLASRVIGVSDLCDFPPEAAAKPKVSHSCFNSADMTSAEVNISIHLWKSLSPCGFGPLCMVRRRPQAGPELAKQCSEVQVWVRALELTYFDLFWKQHHCSIKVLLQPAVIVTTFALVVAADK